MSNTIQISFPLLVEIYAELTTITLDVSTKKLAERLLEEMSGQSTTERNNG